MGHRNLSYAAVSRSPASLTFVNIARVTPPMVPLANDDIQSPRKVRTPVRLFYLPLVAFMMIATCFGQPALGPILLDNFAAGDRTNNAPPAQLWSAYLGEDPGQHFSVANGFMHDVGDSSTGCGATGCGLYVQFMEGQYVAPSGFVPSWIESGIWTPGTVNRLRFKFRCNKTVHGNANSLGHSWGYIGTYTKNTTDTNPSNQGDHWYHTLTGDTFNNHWNLIELNRHPQHQVGALAGNDAGDNPSLALDGINYYDGLTRFYFDTTNAAAADGGDDAWSGVACDFDDFYLDTVTGDPDDLVSNIMVNYDGSHYNLSFNSLPDVNQTYNIAYKTSSMKSGGGFSSGISGGSISTTQNDYTFMMWQSPALSYSATGMYIAIQPTTTSKECASGCFTEVYYPPLDATTSPCDVNGDGQVNQTDVNLALTAALQGAASPDLDGNGVCNVIDVQRVIDAMNGGVCRIGP